MADAIYWNTSALIKLYASEADSSDYLRLLVRQSEDIADRHAALSGRIAFGNTAGGKTSECGDRRPENA